MLNKVGHLIPPIFKKGISGKKVEFLDTQNKYTETYNHSWRFSNTHNNDLAKTHFFICL